MLQHLKRNGEVMVDQEVQSDTDEEEAAANRFAIELLTGQTNYQADYGIRLTAKDLALKSLHDRHYKNIDPGFLALLYGRFTGIWGAANGALKYIESDANPIKSIHSRMLKGLDRERLSPDSDDYLLRIMGAHEAE